MRKRRKKFVAELGRGEMKMVVEGSRKREGKRRGEIKEKKNSGDPFKGSRFVKWKESIQGLVLPFLSFFAFFGFK